MGSNSSSIVITFSIAILLLLILLLILSYNSKAKNDSVERFETPPEHFNSYPENSFAPYNNIMDQSINNFTKFSSYMTENKDNKPIVNSVAANDKYKPDKYKPDENFANMEGSPLNDSYSLLNNATNNEDPSACFKRDKLTATDLLPADASSKWSQINPSSSGELADQNFLTAGYHIGINTIGQSMRNANLQLRSEVPNPQVAVSPWLISTIEPDVRPVSFEIGSAPTTPPS